MSESTHGTATGILHPGAMGVTVAAACSGTVLWASEGRSEATRQRTADAGLTDVGNIASVAGAADIVISVCPPHGAVALADAVAKAGFVGCYVDANAIAPATARRIADQFENFVDGGLIGPPAVRAGTTRLYLSGLDAPRVAARFEGSALEPRVLDGDGPGTASALKMAYAAWTKGASALLAAVAALAATEGVAEELAAEWDLSLPGTTERLAGTAAEVAPKAWRWTGEMDEIAATFAEANLPDGFHQAAGEVYRRLSAFKDAPSTTVEELLEALLR